MSGYIHIGKRPLPVGKNGKNVLGAHPPRLIMFSTVMFIQSYIYGTLTACQTLDEITEAILLNPSQGLFGVAINIPMHMSKLWSREI